MSTATTLAQNKPLADVIDLANYIVHKSFGSRHPIDSVQLQKVLFFAQELFLGMKGSPLFDDKIYAQEYGPTIPRVFKYYIKYAGDKLIHVDMNRAQKAQEDLGNVGVDCLPLLDDIVNTYGQLDATQLIKLSHLKDFAWDRVYNSAENAVCGSHEILLAEMVYDSQRSDGINAIDLFYKVKSAVVARSIS